MKKLLLFLLVCYCLSPFTLFAEISDENKRIFERLHEIVETRYTPSQQQDIYKRLIGQIDILLTRNLDSSRRNILEDIIKLSYEQLYIYDIAQDNNNNLQRVLEFRIRNSGENIFGFPNDGI